MIKLTRLPNPSGAVFNTTYQVSGTLGYHDMVAIDTGFAECYGKDSEQYKALMNIVVDEGKPQEELEYTQADLDAQVKEWQRKYENTSMYAEAVEKLLSAAQKEVERLQGALNLEQKTHDKTKAELDKAIEYASESARAVDRLIAAIDKHIADEFVLQRIRNEAQSG